MESEPAREAEEEQGEGLEAIEGEALARAELANGAQQLRIGAEIWRRQTPLHSDPVGLCRYPAVFRDVEWRQPGEGRILGECGELPDERRAQGDSEHHAGIGSDPGQHPGPGSDPRDRSQHPGRC